jgi:hypothetical protein
MIFGSIQYGVLLVISIGAFAFEAWALIDALRYPAGVYEAAGKQTRGLWAALLGGATVVGFLGLPYPLGFAPASALGILGIAAIAAAGVYAAGVRPALRAIGRSPRQRRDRRGGW